MRVDGLPRKELAMRKTVRIEVLALVVATIMAAVVGVAADAAAVDDPSMIHACMQKKEGTLRVVAAPSECKKSEAPVSWNIEGPAGSALAYARVENGVLDSARSKNVVSMTTTAATYNNVYCFELTIDPNNAVATAEIQNDSIKTPAVVVAGTNAMSALLCPSGTSAAVLIGFKNFGAADSFFVLFN